MDTAASVAARLIGTLFVERGLVSESDVQRALEIQRETGQQLGGILVERFGVSRADVAQVIAEQWHDQGRPAGPDLEAALSESWRRLGEIFVTRGFVTQAELDEAVSRQRQTGERLGEALVALGAISKFHLAGAVAEQMASVDGGVAIETEGETPPGTVVQLPRRAAEAHPEPDEPAPVDETPESTATPEPRALRAVAPVGSKQQVAAGREVVAFVATSAGYVIVPLDAAPEIGATIELDGLGQLEVLRHAAPPLPLDTRTVVVAERRAPALLTFSFAD